MAGGGSGKGAEGGAPLAAGLYLVPTPIGNLGDMPPRALGVLAQADVICCEDTRRTGLLLHLMGLPRKVLVCLEAHREAGRIAEVLARLQAGERVALVSDGGTPCVSDPGQRLVAAAAGVGVKVFSLPGASAVTAAYAASGFGPPWTFYGFVARKGKARKAVFAQIAARADEGALVLESPFRLAALLKELAEDVRLKARPLVLAQEISKIHETYHRGTAEALQAQFRDQPVKGEWTVVIGPAPEAVAAAAEGAPDAAASSGDDASATDDSANLSKP